VGGSGPLRVAVVGAGYMGSIHARVIYRISRRLPGLARLSYIVDVSPERARRLAAELGATPLARVEDLPRGAVDLAVVATPTRLHVETMERLARQGVTAMLVEKPLAPSLEEAEEAVRLEEREGLWVSVGHSERFNPALLALHRLEAEGAVDPRRAAVVSTRRRGPFVERAAAVDVVHDLASHDVDVVLALLRRLPSSLRAYTLTGIYTSLPDYATAHMDAGGTIVHVEVSRIAPPKERLVDILQPGRLIRLDLLNMRLQAYTADGATEHPVEPAGPIDLEDEAVLRALAGGREPPVGTAQAFTVLYICRAILDSAASGGEARLAEGSLYEKYSHIIDAGIEAYRRNPFPGAPA
jgi:UDP-N-acetylglucosamine 3-dehydrogenase